MRDATERPDLFSDNPAERERAREEYKRKHGMYPIAGGADPEDEETPAETPPEEQPKPGDEETPAETPPEEQPKPGDEPSAEEEPEADDEQTQQFLEELLTLPEIKQVIRRAASDAAKAAGAEMKEIRDEMQDEFDDRFDEISKQLKEGAISQRQAERRVREAAAEIAEEAKDKAEEAGEQTPPPPPEPEEPIATDREDRQKAREERREKRRRKQEVDLYRREALLDVDKSKMIVEMVVVGDDTSEDDVDEMIEQAQTAYSKLRKKVIKDLRAEGWRGPKDPTPEDEPVPGRRGAEDEETSPPTRDKSTGPGLDKARKEELRDRFDYGDRGGSDRERPPVGARR
jgi:hypothetical protein